MTGFNHVLTGVVIAVSVRQPVLAPILSLLSHFALDSLPHFGQHPDIVPYNRRFKIYLFIETLLIFAVGISALILFSDQWLLVGVCASLAFLPDVFWLYEPRLKKYRFMRHFYAFHDVIQTGEHPRGWIMEVLYFALLVAIAVQFI